MCGSKAIVVNSIINPNTKQKSHVKSYKEIMLNILKNVNKPESIMGVEEVWLF